jgi:hypothetical protein
MSEFEDHLWSHLMIHSDDLISAPRDVPSRRARHPRMRLGGSLAALAAIAVVVIIALSATSATPPAFAVTAHPDGTITLSIRELKDPDAINATLARLGARARLVPLKQNCAAGPIKLPIRYLQPKTQPWSTDNTSHGPVGNWTVGIIPSRIPAGDTLIFALQEYHHRGWQSASGYVKGPAPQCAAAYGSGLTILSR